MEYKIKTFQSGFEKGHFKTSGPSPVDALKMTNAGYYDIAHVFEGDKVHRFDRSYRPITVSPKFFKITYNGSTPAIVAMFDNLAEIYLFDQKSKRDEVYEKCTKSLFVECAGPGPEPTDITVSFGEISASKSGLTLSTISNGYVMSATWRDLLTRESIAKSSGIAKSKDTDTDEWYSGSKVYPSKQDQTFLATVKCAPDSWDEWPGFNATMHGMIGETLLFKSGSKGMFNAKGYIWQGEWLDTKNITAVVKDMPEDTVHKYAGAVVTYPKNMAGKKFKLTLCPCGCECYYDKNKNYVYKGWLEAPVYD